MARKPKPPLIWNDILDDSGKKIGSYAVEDMTMTVSSARNGAQRVATAGAAPAGTARLMLSEAWAWN
jgi:hypothetical protein